MVALLVETDDFAAAAWALTADAGDPLGDALARLLASLTDCGGMAGSDPAGAAWGRAYDAAASAALVGLRAFVNGCYRLSSMFAASCRNYAAAEQASTADRWVAQSAALDVAQLPGDCSMSWDVTVPSAVGASAGGPPGWSLVMSVVGRAWPGGHQDRLRAAAAAWRSAAAAVDAASARVGTAPDLLLDDRLPEAADVEAVCQAVVATGGRLAGAMDSLAGSCDDLAGELDRVHSDVEHELASLVGQSVVIEGIGFVAGLFTAETAEAPTQWLESWRVQSVAARVAELIDRFSAAARVVGEAVGRVEELAASVSRGLQELLAPRLAVAGLTPVRMLPDTLVDDLASVTGITRTQMSAAEELGAAAGAARGASEGSQLSRICEPIDLRAEEAAGGHTIRFHVGKTVDELKLRQIDFASSFTDLDAATRATEANISAHRALVEQWMAEGGGRLTLRSPLLPGNGVTYVRSTDSVVASRHVITVLVPNEARTAFRVLTSFPSP